jgi:UbiD family decarboxylase
MTGVVMHDPELGKNASTYRCQIKGQRKMAVAPEQGQDGWRFLKAKTKRGEKVAQVAVVCGADPLTFMTFPTKMAPQGVDELEIAGGLHGRPIEVVKCETSDLMVPANAEIIIEGEIPLDDLEEEGPYGEMFGFIGKKHAAYWYMNVKTITQRRNPWIAHSFTGVSCDAPAIGWAADDRHKFKPLIPNLVDINLAPNNIGVIVLSVDKYAAGQGMMAGMTVAANHIVAKVIIVLDKDVDVCDRAEVFRALGSRWQPGAASNIIKNATNAAAWLDPSVPVRGISSQIVIDATRQYPSEGGPKAGEPVSRVIFEERAGEAVKLVNQNWEKYLAGWQR